jgi:hypothetical protein
MARSVRRTSTSEPQISLKHNAALRDLIQPWCGDGITEFPPQCQSVMYSHWSNFTAKPGDSKSSDDLKASVLLAPKGTISNFHPPREERIYLGSAPPYQGPTSEPGTKSDGPMPCGVYCLGHWRGKSSADNSWSTVSSGAQSDPSPKDDALFKRTVIKSTSTTSLLTRAIRISEGVETANPAGILGETLGEGVLTADMLPSAFDSDSEDEDDK